MVRSSCQKQLEKGRASLDSQFEGTVYHGGGGECEAHCVNNEGAERDGCSVHTAFSSASGLESYLALRVT